MRTTLDTARSGSWTKPANPPRAPHRTWLALIFVLIVLAFGLATLIAAASEALSDSQARGEMDGIATADSYALTLVILLAAIVLATAFGIWKIVEADAHDLMGD